MSARKEHTSTETSKPRIYQTKTLIKKFNITYYNFTSLII